MFWPTKKLDKNTIMFLRHYGYNLCADTEKRAELREYLKTCFAYKNDNNEVDFGNRKIVDKEVNNKMNEVLSIFNLASNLNHLESKILNFTGVIEQLLNMSHKL